jgi:O-antigen/teichoic acid export membrane protein
VWALVAGGLLGSCISLVLGFWLLPHRGLRLALERSAALDVYHYAKWIVISSSLTFAAQTADRMLLAAYLTAANLGKYSLAYFLIEAVRQIVSGIMGSVGTGALSEVARERPENLRPVYFRLRLPFDILLGLVAGGLFILGPTVIRILYDDRYELAGQYLALLSLIIPIIRYQQVGPMLVALNRPRLMPVLSAASAIGVFAFIPMGAAFYGEMGAVGGVVAAYYVRLPLIWWVHARFGCLSWWRELQIVPLFALGAALGWAVQMAGASVWPAIFKP